MSALLDERAHARGDATYVFELRGPRTITYGGLGARARSWRSVLNDCGIEEGARIGLLVSDPLDFSEAFIGLLAAGMWVAPLDPTVALTSDEQLRQRTANFDLELIVSDRSAPNDASVRWHDMYACATPHSTSVAPLGPLGEAHGGGVLLASSGTTGTPKVMALGVAQLLCAATLIANHNGLSPDERGLSPLPLWHVNAEVVGLLATLVGGASLALDDRFHRTGFWSHVESHAITWINAVPAIISRLIVLNEEETVPSRVRFIRSASAPLAPALLQQFEAATGIAVIESYGMTEAASQICANPFDGNKKAGSVGRAVGVQVRVRSIDDPGHNAKAFEVGNVEIKGPSVIDHYEASGYEDRFDEWGFLRTGDLGYLDDEDFLFLVGRSDDVINRGGEKIFPREIEESILGLATVVSCAVVGVSHDVYGQVPVLYVQLAEVDASTPTDDITIAVKQLHDVLVSSFARTRRPVSINVVEHFPAHATGKIQKRFLATGSVRVIYEQLVA